MENAEVLEGQENVVVLVHAERLALRDLKVNKEFREFKVKRAKRVISDHVE